MKKTVVIMLLTLVSLCSSTTAKAEERSENTRDQFLRGTGRVNQSTLGFELQVPFASYPGRGMNLPIGLNYSSKVWGMNYVTTQPAANNPGACVSINSPQFAESSASGWTSSLGVPYVEYTGEDNPFDVEGNAISGDISRCRGSDSNTPTPQMFRVKRIHIHLAGGETYELRDESGFATGGFPGSFDGVYYSADGSNLKFTQDSASGIYLLRSADGSTHEFSGSVTSHSSATVRKAVRFADRHGNSMSYNESTNSVTDALGRTFEPVVGLSAPTTPSVTNYTPPGTTGVYRLHWKQLKGSSAAESAIWDFGEALKYSGDKFFVNNVFQTRAPGTFLFGSTDYKFVVAPNQLFNPVLLTKIELPTGLSYEFKYDTMGRMNRISYPSGGREVIDYALIPQLAGSDPGDIKGQTNFGVVNRRTFHAVGQNAFYEWKHRVTTDASDAYIVTTINPDGTKSVRYLHRSDPQRPAAFGYESGIAGNTFREDVLATDGRLVSQKLTEWVVTQFPNGDNHPKDWHPRVVREEMRIFDSRNVGISTVSTADYHGDLSLRETPVLTKRTAQYPFTVVGSDAPIKPIRSTESTYLINDPNISASTRDLYRQKHLINLQTSSVIKDSNGQITSRSDILYDEPEYSPQFGVGNPTTVRLWISLAEPPENSDAYISTRIRYDSFGNRIESIDARGNMTRTEYDPSNNAFPVRTTTAVPDLSNTNAPNVALITQTTFDQLTGLQLSDTDPNGLETRREYDRATMRLVSTKKFFAGAPVGGVTEMVYGDVTGNMWVKSRNQLDTDRWEEKISYFDGLGRVIRIEDVSSDGNIVVEKEFDAEGRLIRISNPYKLGSMKFWTSYRYDETGRVKEIIYPDGSKVITDWGVLVSDLVGITKTVTDQAGMKRRSVTDAVGRIVRFIEDPDGENR